MTGPHLRPVDDPSPPASDEPSDEALMLLAQSGDRAAFSRLVTRHQRAVRRLAETIVGDPELARDLAQETFVAAWAARERFDAGRALRPWLFTIARNHARSKQRWRRIRTMVGLGDASLYEAPVASDRLVADEEAQLVRAALDRLPEKFRVPLILRFVEELDYDAIAEVIGRTPSTARSRIHYGLKHLAAKLPHREDLSR